MGFGFGPLAVSRDLKSAQEPLGLNAGNPRRVEVGAFRQILKAGVGIVADANGHVSLAVLAVHVGSLA